MRKHGAPPKNTENPLLMRIFFIFIYFHRHHIVGVQPYKFGVVLPTYQSSNTTLEDIMKLSLAALSIATLALMPVAHAADARFTDCIAMQKQVAAALDTAPTGDSTEQARFQANTARAFCASHLYVQGVSHYTQALHLLGRS